MPKKKPEPKEKKSTIQAVRKDIDPQLCKVYNPIKHDWSKAWMVEPKFDGIRCIIIVDFHEDNWTPTAYSRNGKPLWNMNLILEEIRIQCLSHFRLTRNHKLPDGIVLDGEVHTKDWNLSMGIVKSSTISHPDADKLRFHVWDCLTLEEWKAGKSPVSNHDRKERLSFLGECKYTEIVQHQEVISHEGLQEVYTEFLTAGYEGIILKRPEGIYELGRRSPNWIKLKPWVDADLIVTGAYAGEGKHIGRIGGLQLTGQVEWNGKKYNVTTEVGTGFTDQEREFFQTLWNENRLVGKVVEIKFQDVTVDGACRFPVYHRLRDDK